MSNAWKNLENIRLCACAFIAGATVGLIPLAIVHFWGDEIVSLIPQLNSHKKDLSGFALVLGVLIGAWVMWRFFFRSRRKGDIR